MEKNIYAQHKQAVKAISEKEGVDIGVACAMLRDKMGWFADEKDAQITQFCAFVEGMTGEEVKAYFAE